MHTFITDSSDAECYACGLRVELAPFNLGQYPIECDDKACSETGVSHYMVAAPNGAECYYCGHLEG